jgi:hypothetical protein
MKRLWHSLFQLFLLTFASIINTHQNRVNFALYAIDHFNEDKVKQLLLLDQINQKHEFELNQKHSSLPQKKQVYDRINFSNFLGLNSSPSLVLQEVEKVTAYSLFIFNSTFFNF